MASYALILIYFVTMCLGAWLVVNKEDLFDNF